MHAVLAVHKIRHRNFLLRTAKLLVTYLEVTTQLVRLSNDLPQRLLIVQLVNKVTSFHMTQSFTRLTSLPLPNIALHFNIIFSATRSSLRSSIFSSGFPTKTFVPSSNYQCVLHAPPISSLVWSLNISCIGQNLQFCTALSYFQFPSSARPTKFHSTRRATVFIQPLSSF